MSAAVTDREAYVFGPLSPAFNTDLAIAFARLVTHGHGGSFRLTRAAQQELGDVRISRHHDAATGDLVFTVETEISQ